MNKKNFAGTVVLGIAASFWACGSGEIIKPDNDDNTMAIEVPDNPALGITKDVMNAASCPVCFEGASSSSTKQQPRKPLSTATIPGPTSTYVPPVQQSSSSEFQIKLSSSVPYSYTPRSSSDPGPIIVSSSSVVVDVNQAGTCAPDPSKATIDVGGSTTWKYTRGSGVAAASLLNAVFAWEFEGGTPPTANVTGAGGMSQNVTYATSGQHGAKLTLTIGASHYPITCSPVQVNGAKITGCKCTALKKTPDIADGEMGTWSVTGCSSMGHQIIGYEWPAGFTGDGAAATFAFTAKKQSQAPIVKVANDDNTVVSVQCEKITAVDRNDPDYVIDGTAAGTFTVGPGTYKMTYACKTSTFYQRSIIIEAPNGPVTASVAGKSYSVRANGRAETYKSTTSNKPIDVEIISGTAKISCE